MAFLMVVSGLTQTHANTVIIGNSRGGEIIDFAIKYAKIEKSGSMVKIAGSCQSACTLVLTLRNVCVTPSAKFMFHAPYGASIKGNKIAKDYLWKKYPAWVKSYINARGGLTKKEIWMDYSVLKKRMKTC